MTQFLINHFISEKGNITDPIVRSAYGKLAGITGIFCNLLLFTGKYIIGTLFGSIAIAADAINNLSDASSNIISLLGFKLGSKLPDAEHPYGHGRYEYLAGLAICVIILSIGFSLAKESLDKISHPDNITFSWLSVIVLLISIAVKFWMSSFNRTIGNKINSDALIATAADSRNDVISTSAVLLSSFLCKLTGIMVIDGIMGLAVAVFILYSGIVLIKETLSPLLGEAPNPKLVQYIENKVCNYPGVLGMHDLMIHDYGPGNQFVSLHVEFPAEEDVLKAHDIVDNIEHDFLVHDNLMVTIHYDPIVTEDHEVNDLRAYISKELKNIDRNLSIHDLRIVPGTSHTNVIFDCVVPAGFSIPQDQLQANIKSLIQKKSKKYIGIIRIEQDFSGNSD